MKLNKITKLFALVGLGASLTLAGCMDTPNASVRPAKENSVSQTIWKDNSTQMDQFISELMAKMTTEEKIGQLNLLTSNWDTTGPTMSDDYLEQIKSGKVGAIFNAFTAKYTKELQRVAVEETRLGIPLLFGYDVIHGHRTIFPISLGEAASWDMDAIREGSRIAATEAAAEGIHWTFAPMIDISRDPRWGRVSEGSGEDVFLSTEIARARVQGFQGDDLKALDTVLACAKHYAAYGQAQAGRDYHTTNMSERELWDTYLPPFKATVDEGAASFMTAFNELNGIPATGSNFLLNDVLKTQWGFEGFVVTDYTAINEMVPHGFAADEKHAGELALNAGVDMDMQGSVFTSHLNESLEEGKVSIEKIDNAVRRILEMKYRLGLFEDPYRYSDEERQEQTIYKPEFIEAARDMARKSMVLLKNEQQVLPLKKSGQSIALIGPLADSKQDMIGSWSAAGERWNKPVTLFQGLKEKLGDQAKIHYAKGASYEFDAKGTEGFDEAIAAAKKSDVIVMAMGENWRMTGEAASRVDLDLPGNQQALMKELKKLGKPMVLVLMNGRPMTINWADENVDSILETWYAGTVGGHAIADVLFGDYNPSGKLPMTFPRAVGQVPIYYNMKNTGRPIKPEDPEQKYVSRYLNTPNTPLYPFGFGLSYTTFGYSDITLSADTLSSGASIKASVTVTNTGDYDGEEVVQLYIRDRVGSVTRPVKELKGFEKIMLAKGESRQVEFEIRPEQLAFHGADMSYGYESGEFDVYIGSSSTDVKQSSFTLTESKTLQPAKAPMWSSIK
ncbi:beta-glucosidase BglX [Alteromonas ponticola]|uniref:beta-glucosidase n=1 Tax=Alteromonas ponticola TaxID=2720613 RepID=A0ABX1R4Y3_9ALTE|nr:beta-glucosidase BglX [Alteromonas ponticola]NMH61488.1 beta-glucosidase BglX [Alteromonas ponticola]